jgi:hypothetical protein
MPGVTGIHAPPRAAVATIAYMIVEYIRYTIDATRADDFLRAYETAATSLRASPHCQGRTARATS